MKTWKTLTWAPLALLALTATAHADSSAAAGASSSSSSNLLSTIRKNLKASVLVSTFGMSTQSLSGNTDGTGRNLNQIYYPSVSYKVHPKWSLSAAQPLQYVIDENPNTERLVVRDPYFTLSNGSIYKHEPMGINLGLTLRYYAPFSRATNRTVKGLTDSGRGQFRVYVNPTKTFMDGALTLSGMTILHARLNESTRAERQAKNGTTAREDYYVILNPSVSYDWTPKFSTYIEYASGYLRHRTTGGIVGNPLTGRWTKFNDPALGQYVGPGAYWVASKRVSVNPYISWGPEFKLKKGSLGVDVNFSIL